MKFITLISLFATAVHAGVPRRLPTDAETEEKIIGGQDAPDGAFPYIASLRYGNNHRCGAIIIHHEWVITAASCVAGLPESSFSVVVGTNWLNTGGSKYPIIATYPHEKFDQYTNQNNVAIIRVKSIKFTDKIGSITLEKEYMREDELCIFSGWGYTSFPGSNPHILQYIHLRTISNVACRKANEGQASVTASQICSFTRIGQGSCIGDTGGPLVRTVRGIPKLVAIMNWMVSPCASGKPDVYSRVSSYYGWFQEKCQNCFK